MNIYLDIQWRWVATILERAETSKDKVLAIRERDFDVIKEFLAVGGILRPAAVLAIRDLGFPVGTSILAQSALEP